MSQRTIIHGDLFVPWADIIYAWRRQAVLDEQALRRRLKAWEGDLAVIYCDGHHANRLNDALRQLAGNRVLLITHNSDACVRTEALREFDIDYRRRASCVEHWFSQNVEVDGKELSPLPIGLERPHLVPHEVKVRILERKMGLANTRKHLLYVNHSVTTNPEEREKPYRMFGDKSYALVKRGYNGMDYRSYLDDLASSAYCISPPGNGLECHRTWEALYLGCVPIVKRSASSERLYSGLPVMQVDDFAEVNEEMLRDSLPRFPQAAFRHPALYLEHYRQQFESCAARFGRRRRLASRKPSWFSGVIDRFRAALA